MSSPSLSFPRDSEGQTFVSVKALVAGHVWLSDNRTFLDAASLPDDQGHWLPAFSFLITHPTKGKALFDLGVRKDAEGYPPALVDRVKTFKPDCKVDVADILRSGGVDPADIDTLIYSHMHWDHIGDPERIPRARIVLGGESRSLLEDPYPPNVNSRFLALPAGRPVDYIDFVRSGVPFGPFESVHDLYGDGSLYLIDAPGHVLGHTLAAARVAPNTFLLLAGDTCHSPLCYHGHPPRTISKEMYADWEVARATVANLTRVDQEMSNVLVMLAHDWEREQEVPLFPEELKSWAVQTAKKREGK